MDNPYLVVLVTAPSQEVGQRIAQHLLQQRLAACVNIIPSIRSLYWWEGKIQTDEEVLLVIKSRAELFDQHLLPAVKALHPYQVPEIIALPIVQGFEAYLKWIADTTQLP
jgi:periplasmic divalent cation tolerance protein